MTIRGGPVYVQDHRHEFPFEERKNWSVVIGPCVICGSAPTPVLLANGWAMADDDDTEGPPDV